MRKTREEINVDVQRKGASQFLQLEVLLDIRELLGELLEAVNESNNKK